MRIVREFLQGDCKITLFHWNGKYILKIESGNLEQTFKVPEFDVSGDDDAVAILDEKFMLNVMARFDDMQKSFLEAIRRNEQGLEQ